MPPVAADPTRVVLLPALASHIRHSPGAIPLILMPRWRIAALERNRGSGWMLDQARAFGGSSWT